MASSSKKRATHHPSEGGDADPGQSRRFIEAARELGADQSEEAFNEALRKVAKAPAHPRERKGADQEPSPSNRRARKTYTTKRLKPDES